MYLERWLVLCVVCVCIQTHTHTRTHTHTDTRARVSRGAYGVYDRRAGQWLQSCTGGTNPWTSGALHERGEDEVGLLTEGRHVLLV
jgi:hypothetical protein